MNSPHEAVQYLYHRATLDAERAASLVSEGLAERDQLAAKVAALEKELAALKVVESAKPVKATEIRRDPQKANEIQKGAVTDDETPERNG